MLMVHKFSRSGSASLIDVVTNLVYYSLQTGCAWPMQDRPWFDVVAMGVANLSYNVWSIHYSNEFVHNTSCSFSCSLFWLHLYSIHPHMM